MLKIVEVKEDMALFDEAVRVFWEQWGNKTNYMLYEDCMKHSTESIDDIPRFYIALNDDSIIGTYALLRNDFISRQDLFPWLACLYVDPNFRGNEIGSQLLKHALSEAANKGFSNLYLSSDLENFYEKYGWTHIAEGYGASGGSIKIYEKRTKL